MTMVDGNSMGSTEVAGHSSSAAKDLELALSKCAGRAFLESVLCTLSQFDRAFEMTLESLLVTNPIELMGGSGSADHTPVGKLEAPHRAHSSQVKHCQQMIFSVRAGVRRPKG
jgi:hypothetical protein